MIILEGPDGGGKTTLAKMLQDEFDLLYHHEGPPPIEVPPLIHYGRVLQDLRGRDLVAVIDRWAFGERVYGPVVRRADRLGPEGWRVAKRLMRAAGALHVLCMPDYGVCYEHWSSGREELMSKRVQFDATYATYDRSRAEFDYVYDYTHENAWAKLMQFLIDNPTCRLPLPCVGSPEARVLFVGEQIGEDKRLDLPFFATTGSSEYLTRAIDAAGLKEDQIAFVNAFDVEGKSNVIPTSVWDRKFRIVALGNHAAAACREQRLEFKTVPHPQYWRRFHHQNVEGYAELIRSAL